MTNIMLVEDHVSFRQAMAVLLESEPEFHVVAQAGFLAEAREVLDSFNGTRPDVAIVDLSLPDGISVGLIQELVTDLNVTVLLLSASFDRTDFALAVEVGAAGVLHKSAALDEIIDAVRRLQA